MISEIVLFSLPEGLSREEAMAKYRARVSVWQSNPDLIHKAFLYDEASRRGGGVYHGRTLRRRNQRTAPPFKRQFSPSSVLSRTCNTSRPQS